MTSNEQNRDFGNLLYSSCVLMLRACTEASQTGRYLQAYEINKKTGPIWRGFGCSIPVGVLEQVR